MSSLLYLLPLYLFPFGDLLSLPYTFAGFVSLCAAIGVINIIKVYPISFLYAVYVQLNLLLINIFFNENILHKNFGDSYPVYRGLFSVFWWTPIIISLLKAKLLVTKSSFYRFLSFNLYVSALLGLISIFIYLFSKFRPSLTFGESSWLGLYFYSTLGLFIPFINSIETKKLPFFKSSVLIIFFGGFSTSSTHIISFLFAISVYLVITKEILNKFIKIFTNLKLYKSLLITFLNILLIFLAFFLIVFFNNDLRYRLDSLLNYLPLIRNISSPSFIEDTSLFTNISVLSWLNSSTRAFHVLRTSPLWGFGPGSTGYFEFMGRFYENLLLATNGQEINFTDGYSLLFRGVTEYGSLFLFVIILNFRRFIINFQYGGLEKRGLCLMAFVLLIGALLKQPILPAQIVFLAFYLPLIKVI